MTDYLFKFAFVDRGGNNVYAIFEHYGDNTYAARGVGQARFKPGDTEIKIEWSEEFNEELKD